MANKAKTIVDKAIAKAKKERDTKGYRENLGYEQYNKVKERVQKLGLSYNEVEETMSYFEKQCDTI